MEFPFRAEYAKSGRASCKQCKSPILKDSLRMAVMVQSPFFDGRQPNWHHFHCFFSKPRVKTVDDIEHFESLRIEDQDKIKEKVGGGAAAIVVPEAKTKGKKRTVDKSQQEALKLYTIQYAKSGRAACRGCEQKILKDEIRIAKKDFETEIGMKYGGQDLWHHVPCFAQVRAELGYFESADKIPGFKSLKKEDQNEVLKQIPAIKQEEIPVKKIKKEEDDPQEKEYREQIKIMFKYRDDLKNNLDKTELAELLEFNNQKIPSGEEEMLDRLADLMAFGTLEPCTDCKGGQFVFNKVGYICHGNLTEWSKCQKVTKDPKRRAFKVAKELAAEYPFLKKYKYVKRVRVIKEVRPTVTDVKKEDKDEADGPRVKRDLPPLYDMTFVILLTKVKDELKKHIVALGGKVVTKIDRSVMAVIADKEMVEKKGARVQLAEDMEVHVVGQDFIDEAKENGGKIPDLVAKKSICDWGSDPSLRLPPEPSTSAKSKSKSGSIYTKSIPSKLKLKLKDGNAVDPDSGLQDVAHVYNNFNAVLGLTDIQANKNSYYKLQLLKHDKADSFWVFRSWGRIGTTVGNTKLEDCYSLHDAERKFRTLYEEKTGNVWDNRHNFVKVPGRMYPIDIDYGEDNTKDLEIVASESKLPKPVQDLIHVMFDVNSMKKLMLEFELDTEKMPLGKLSKKQIQNALKVLTELQELVESNAEQARLIDATNRFYTLIPHSFGVDKVQVLNDLKVIQDKVEMLDSLMEMEIAYNLMKSGTEHTVDSYYTQLKAEIDPLDKNSEEYKIIEEYVRNTHAETHTNYELVVEEVFVLKREGEEKRFKPFKKLHNRKLLWHGSRVTNFVGIISQGLRIAPPEAPCTGYMFGKGIYFADMVSKSANYCCTDRTKPTGLMLLSEVALGNMHEVDQAVYVEKAPKGKHSLKGRGRTHPDPSMAKKIHNEVEVPLGKGVPNPDGQKSSLLYNEYIVYDVAQVNIKYLLKMHFAHKY